MDSRSGQAGPPREPKLPHRASTLMAKRVNNILLVSSLYDSFTLSEDGKLSDMILSEFLDLNLRHTPGLTRVSTGKEAQLAFAHSGSRDYLGWDWRSA